VKGRRAPAPALAAMLLVAGGRVDAQPPSTGADVYDYWCATCHAPGPGMPGTQALQAKYDGSVPAVLLERPGLSAQYIAAIVRTGISVMPPFRKTEISDADLAALTDYMVEASRAAADVETAR